MTGIRIALFVGVVATLVSSLGCIMPSSGSRSESTASTDLVVDGTGGSEEPFEPTADQALGACEPQAWALTVAAEAPAELAFTFHTEEADGKLQIDVTTGGTTNTSVRVLGPQGDEPVEASVAAGDDVVVVFVATADTFLAWDLAIDGGYADAATIATPSDASPEYLPTECL